MTKIDLLNPSHDRNRFDCGRQELNRYLRGTARQHIEKGVSHTYVLVDDAEPDTILGYCTISVCELAGSDLPPPHNKKLPKLAPAVRLARLAVHQEHQRRGIGWSLLMYAVEKAITVDDSTGVTGLVVDAKDDDAKEYYEQFGFQPFPDSPLALFLPTATLRKALEP
jgi:GNAT superfamily N-acetyltransferase